MSQALGFYSGVRFGATAFRTLPSTTVFLILPSSHFRILHSDFHLPLHS